MNNIYNEITKVELLFGENTEVGFLISLKEVSGSTLYEGDGEISLSSAEPIESGVATKSLKALKFYPSDNLEILARINAYREIGVDARLLSVFRLEGNTFINHDETENYVSARLLIKLK